MVNRFKDENDAIYIPLTEESIEESTAEVEEGGDNLEQTETDLGFEEQSDGVWFKTYE